MASNKGKKKVEVVVEEKVECPVVESADKGMAIGKVEAPREFVSIEDHLDRIKYLLDSGTKGHREIDLAVSDAFISLEKLCSLVKFIAAAEFSLIKKNR